MAVFEDLILCYPLNSDGAELQNGYDGSPSNMSWVSGTVGNAADFNGTNGYISCGRVNALENLSSFSIAFWINVDVYASGFHEVFYAGDSSGAYIAVKQYSSSIYLYVYTDSGNYYQRNIPSSKIPATEWHHVVFTFASGSMTVYVDGASYGAGTGYNGTAAPPTGQTSVYFGSKDGSTEFFDGKVDQFCAWDRELTSTEVSALYNSGDGIPFPLGGLSAGHLSTTESILGNGYPDQLPVGSFTETSSITGTPSDTTTEKYLNVGSYSISLVHCDPEIPIWTLAYPGGEGIDDAIHGDGCVYVLTNSDHIYKYDVNGLVWSYLSATTPTGIAIDDTETYLYYSSTYTDGRVRKIALSDRSEITTGDWPLTSTEITGQATGIKMGPDGYLYVVVSDEEVYKIDPSDGSVEWSYAIPQGGDGNDYNTMDINSSGTVVIGSIEVGNTGEPLRQLTSAGALDWAIYPYSRQMPVTQVSITDAGVIYFYMYNEGYLTCDSNGANVQDSTQEDFNASRYPWYNVIEENPSWGIYFSGHSNATLTNEIDTEITDAAYVAVGEDYTVYFAADTDYLITDVEIDSVSQGAITEYTFSDVTGQHFVALTVVQGYAVDPLTDTNSITATNEQVLKTGGNLETIDSVLGVPAIPVSAGSLGTVESVSGVPMQMASGDGLSITDSISATNNQIISAGELNTVDSILGVGFSPNISAGSFVITDSINGGFQIIDTDGMVPLFKLILTGAADGTTDIAIPISSFQMRMYDGQSTYLSVTIPNVDYADEITARSNGNLDLYLMYAPASDLANPTIENRIVIVALDTVTSDNGAVNKSVTLSGYETTAQRNAREANPKTVTLDDSWFSYVRTSGGLYTLRMVKPHLTLSAGDTVSYDGASITASRITWVEGESYHYMEIAEAA